MYRCRVLGCRWSEAVSKAELIHHVGIDHPSLLVRRNAGEEKLHISDPSRDTELLRLVEHSGDLFWVKLYYNGWSKTLYMYSRHIGPDAHAEKYRFQFDFHARREEFDMTVAGPMIPTSVSIFDDKTTIRWNQYLIDLFTDGNKELAFRYCVIKLKE